MDYKHYAKHKCGNIREVPFGNSGFLTQFGELCPKCGERWRTGEFETFVGKYISKFKLFKPSTWFVYELELKGVNNA